MYLQVQKLVREYYWNFKIVRKKTTQKENCAKDMNR